MQDRPANPNNAPVQIAKTFFEGHQIAWSMFLDYQNIQGIGATSVKKLMGAPGTVLDFAEHMKAEQAAHNPDALRDASIRTGIDSILHNPLTSLLILNGRIAEEELKYYEKPYFKINSDDAWERDFAGWEETDKQTLEANAAVGNFLDSLSTHVADFMISKWNTASSAIQHYLFSTNRRLETDLKNERFQNIDDALWQTGVSEHLKSIPFTTSNQKAFYGLSLRNAFQNTFSIEADGGLVRAEPSVDRFHVANQASQFNQDAFLDEYIQLEDDMIQQEKEMLLESYRDTELSHEEVNANKKFLQGVGLPSQLSSDDNENHVMHARLNQILSNFEKQATQQSATMQAYTAFNALNFIGALGVAFHNKEIQAFSFFSKSTLSMSFSIAEMIESLSAPITLASLNPIMTAVTVGLNLFSYFSNDDEDAQEERLAEFNAIRSMFQSLFHFLNDYAQHTDERFNRVERYGYYYFTQTKETLKVIYEAISSYYQLLQLRSEHNKKELDIKLKQLMTVGQENLLLRLEEAYSLVTRNKRLTGDEYRDAIRSAEFYLHHQAKNTAFTGALTSTLDVIIPQDAFGLEQLDTRLSNADPFNQLGYLFQYVNNLLGLKQSTPPLANPYVYLRAMNILTQAILKEPDKFEGYDDDKLKKLIAPALANLDFFKLVRSHYPRFLLNYETARKNLIDYLSEQLKLFNAKNTNLGIDIHSNMDELATLYKHSNISKPITSIINPSSTRQTKVQGYHAPWMVGCLFFCMYDIQSLQLEIRNFNKEMLAVKDCEIPVEVILAEKIGLTNNLYQFVMMSKINYPQRELNFDVILSQLDNQIPSEASDIIHVHKSIKGTEHDLPLLNYDPTSNSHRNSNRKAESISYNTQQIKEFFYRASITKCDQLNKAAIDTLHQRLNKLIFLDARTHFAKMFLDPLFPESIKFNELRDKLNEAYLVLMEAVIATSFGKIDIPQNASTPVPTLYNGNSIQNILTTLQTKTDLSELDFILEHRTQSNYEIFKTQILEQAKVIDTNSSIYHPIESSLRSSIAYLKSINTLIKKQNQQKPAHPFKNIAPQSASLHSAVENCDEKKTLQAIADTYDLNIINEQGKTAIDLALQCTDKRKRNRLLMNLVENRAYRCSNPQEVANLLQDILEKSRDILSEIDYAKLERANHRFCQYHHIIHDENDNQAAIPITKQHTVDSPACEGSAWPFPGACAQAMPERPIIRTMNENIPDDVFRVEPSQPAPALAAPTTFLENLLFFQCALPIIKPYLPWCKEAILTPDDLHSLQAQQKNLHNYELKFPTKQFAYAEKLGVPLEQFTDLSSRIHSTQKLITTAIKNNKISSSNRMSIKVNMERIDKLTIALTDSKLSHELRQAARKNATFEKRLAKKALKQGMPVLVSQAGFFSTSQNTTYLPIEHIEHKEKNVGWIRRFLS
jgi:hypothetical protein